MSANTAPVFTLTPNVNSCLVTAANTSSQGAGTVGTSIFVAFTAGANGSFVRYVRLMPTATVAATATTATVARIFVSKLATGTTSSADTFLLAEVALSSVSADSSTVGNTQIDVPINEPIPAGYTIMVTMHAAPAANSAWRAVVFGGDY